MNHDIEITRGRTEDLGINVYCDGKPYDLADGETLVFGVKKRTHHEDLLIKKTLTEGEEGVYPLTIDPEDTIDLRCGKYFYDVSLQSGTKCYPVIKASAFTIGANVTKSGDAE